MGRLERSPESRVHMQSLPAGAQNSRYCILDVQCVLCNRVWCNLGGTMKLVQPWGSQSTEQTRHVMQSRWCKLWVHSVWRKLWGAIYMVHPEAPASGRGGHGHLGAFLGIRSTTSQRQI
eukprot:1367513-Pyramimonas_sp.AAC.1